MIKNILNRFNKLDPNMHINLISCGKDHFKSLMFKVFIFLDYDVLD